MPDDATALPKPGENRWARLLREGPIPALKRRYGWYKSIIQIDNYYVGRLIELSGNRVRMDGLVISVDSPSVSTRNKSALYFGFHEADEREILKKHLPRGLPVIEFGAGIGVISCLTNRGLDEPSRHVVIEANPRLIPVIERNRSLNRCRFTVLNKALAYDSPTIEFDVKADFVRSGGGEDATTERVSVATTTLKEVADGAGFDQFSVVCDIEGYESLLVDREADVLAARVPFLLVEIHPWMIGDEATADARQAGWGRLRQG